MTEDFKGIGILGGVGPHAGCVLHQHILQALSDKCHPVRDQDYAPIFHLSWSKVITDRTEFLLGNEPTNPAFGALKVMKLFQELALSLDDHLIIGIPCNTFHAKAIFDVFQSQCDFPNLKVLNMITACSDSLVTQQLKKVGVLSTNGTRQAKLYPSYLEPKGIEVVLPSQVNQQCIHEAIYDPEWGIKSSKHQPEKTRNLLVKACDELTQLGADSLILGCTELPLVLNESSWQSTPLVDPMRSLARALVAHLTLDLKPKTYRKP